MGCAIMIILILIALVIMIAKSMALAGAIAIVAVIFGAAIIKAIAEDRADKKRGGKK